jgi:deazaflavin-dependent oxidoreductase (nitroreductase family)
MPEKIADPQPPRGVVRFFARAPIFLYRAGLGWMFGGRFLMLTHTGRVSGLPRHVVLEVVREDRQKRAYIVASGWGERSDWYKNILKNPQVTVQVRRTRFNAHAQRLTPEQAGEEMLAYARRHPAALQQLARLMGYRLGRAEGEARAFGRLIPMFVLQPIDPNAI